MCRLGAVPMDEGKAGGLAVYAHGPDAASDAAFRGPPNPPSPISRDNLSRAATRFSVEGWVENRLSIPRPESGLTIKSGAVVGWASPVSLGTASATREILTSA